MLYTKDLEDVILYAPALITGSACSSLKIISGFTDCERISSHLISLLDGIKEKKYVSNIKISLILGMTKGSSLTKKKHKKICQTIKRVQTMRGMPKITCRYIASGQEVHSKVYLWSKGNTPEAAFCGSANYSINAFQRRRECMTDCDPNEAKAYYNSLYKDSIDCFDPDIEIKMSFAETAVSFIEDVSDDNLEKLSYEEYTQKTPIDQIRVSLLMATVKEIQEAIREDCRSQHDMDSTDIDRVMQTLPFAQEEPFTGARPQKPLFWFYARKFEKR